MFEKISIFLATEVSPETTPWLEPLAIGLVIIGTLLFIFSTIIKDNRTLILGTVLLGVGFLSIFPLSSIGLSLILLLSLVFAAVYSQNY